MQSYSSLSPKFKGEAKVIKYKVEGNTLEPIEELSSPNIINKRSIERLFLSNTYVFDNSRRIAMSTDNYLPDFERIQVNNIIAIGDPSLSGVSGYNYANKTELTPRAVTYHNRFLTPAVARTFQTIAIVDGTANNNTANITANSYAQLSFDNPISQEINEIIDIFYKVYLEWSSDPINLGERFQNELELIFFAQSNLPIRYEHNNLCEEIISHNQSDRDLRWKAVDDNPRVSLFSSSYTQRTNYLKREYTATASFPMDRHYFGITYGRLERSSTNPPYYYGFKGTGGAVPIQMPSAIGNVFSHSDTGSLFYNANALANASWKPIITDVEERDDDLPCLYTLKVESSGGEGIGTYSLYKTLYSGGRGANSNWQQMPRELIITSKYPHFFPADNDVPYNAKWIYNWTTDLFWVSANDTTVAIWKIYPEFETVSTWDLSSSHSVARIHDLATNPDTEHIYVATQQGLFDIDVATDTVTLLSSDTAQAVDVGYNNSVFASFDDRLGSSLNASWADSHSFTGTIVWSNVIFIRCDRTSTDYNLAILEHRYNQHGGTVYANISGSWYARLHWWNNPSGYVSTIQCRQVQYSFDGYWHKSITHPYNSSFVVKDGIWVYPKDYYNSRSLDSDRTLSFDSEIAKALAASGINIFDGNSRNCPVERSTGIAKFNQDLRQTDTSYYLNSDANYSLPSHAILSSDISSGYIPLVIGRYSDANSVSSGYDHSQNFDYTVGWKEFEVSETDDTVLGTRGPNGNNNAIHALFFSWYDYGASSRQLYCLSGNVQATKTGGIICFRNSFGSRETWSTWGSTFNGHPKGNNQQYYHPIMISIWGGYNGYWQEFPGWSTRYGWNDISSAWEEDPDNLLPGKALHTADETLVDGLSIAWNDLAPGDTRDLVAGQLYTFTRIPGNYGFVSDGTFANVPIKYSYYLHPVVLYNLNATISGTQLTLDPVSSDNLWLSLDPFDESVIELNIDGYAVPATILLSGTPGANEILVADAVGGILEFNAVDNGKIVSGTVLYMQKIHETEVL